ncbi:MAG TPA: NifU family protein, partial [bacterium]|nr:NifU family protein [bacterium]
KLTNLQKIALIQKVVQEEIRPVLAKDNGDLVLMDVVGNRVLVSLRGSCAGCPVAPITLKSYVQEKLRELVSEDLVVEEVPS